MFGWPDTMTRITDDQAIPDPWNYSIMVAFKTCRSRTNSLSRSGFLSFPRKTNMRHNIFDFCSLFRFPHDLLAGTENPLLTGGIFHKFKRVKC